MHHIYDDPLLKSLLGYLPPSLRDPAMILPVIVGFYVIFLGLCLTGALSRQGKQIKKVKDKRKDEQFALDSDDEKDWREFQASIRKED
ncbi:uncharacterized protein LY89DRAFT_781710 [Mollisia scopiformis]|uniref:Uncharacterized protein n=1 Tax=Mollisia scopiformis TaxID=149040 RepID=A0A194XBI0_MOLSC|nr:uncharacterized protein LY89DRAFT_781710 [Mollisia scopiformis]KUJ17516.1 hypothetical protein LY89DRAFT_781710 [Mollisia scopiformis]